MRLPFETVLDIKTFTGRKFDRVQNNAIGSVIEEIAPQGVKNWIGYSKQLDPLTGKLKYEFDEKLFYVLFESWMFSRMLRSADRAFEDGVLTMDEDFMQWFLTATTTERLDLDQEELIKLKRKRRLVEDELVRRGVKRRIPLTIDQVPAER